MALILAIESDRRQVNHLTAMVRARLHAELVLADTAEAALERLGDRLPDLILTSPLMSPKDEQALTDRLRKLDGVASHVQTLTLPFFAPVKSRSAAPARGVLSALLGDRSGEATPDGCDPAVFAEQCRAYLERSAAEREARVPNEIVLPADTPEITVVTEPAGIDEAIVLAAAEPPEPPAANEPSDAEGEDLDIDLSGLLEPEPSTSQASADDGDDGRVIYELSDVSLEPAEIETFAEQKTASSATGPTDFDDWEQVVEALQRESKRVQLPARKEPVRPDPPAVAAPAPPRANVKPMPPPRRPRQPEDEWGVFDPEQAGMAALFAKLAQLADEDEKPARRA
jgi:CheY-like chemotaxis protein